MLKVEKSVYIEAPIEKVWAALTDPTAIGGWMGADSVVEVDLKVGGQYRLFGGETTGRFARIHAPGELDYTWRQGQWKKNWADSMVHCNLTPVGSGTQVHLIHERFPNRRERDDHAEGWDLYWLGPMKEWLEA